MNDRLNNMLPLSSTAMNLNSLNDGNLELEECSICFESCVDKAFVNDCLHQFCYTCITTWSQLKAVCPLCIQPMSGIINNITSLDNYNIAPVIPPEVDVLAVPDNDFEFPSYSTDIESSYDEMDPDSEFDQSEINGDEYDNSGDDYNFDSDNRYEYHRSSDDFPDSSENGEVDHDQSAAASFSENESICYDEPKDDNDDWENGNESYEGDNAGEDEYEDNDVDNNNDSENNNDEYEADYDEDVDADSKCEENCYYSECSTDGTDAEEGNENSNSCDNFSHDNGSEDEVDSLSYTQDESFCDYYRDDEDAESDEVELSYDANDVNSLSDYSFSDDYDANYVNSFSDNTFSDEY